MPQQLLRRSRTLCSEPQGEGPFKGSTAAGRIKLGMVGYHGLYVATNGAPQRQHCDMYIYVYYVYIYISMSSRCGIPACGKDCFSPLFFRHLGSSWMETAPSQEYGISHHTVSDLHLDCTFQQWVLNLLGWSRALGDPKSVGVWSFFPEFISMFDGKAPKLLQNSGVFLFWNSMISKEDSFLPPVMSKATPAACVIKWSRNWGPSSTTMRAKCTGYQIQPHRQQGSAAWAVKTSFMGVS